ncbi:protein SPT2 homolog [Musca vetustissima]|uniref:protein SPT2 homolog n=1 Tax=Musca vetustissima TaxID=27455 RepID=UPI002AB7C3DC|nr:protein SPT2 homolog [Musca vetustissima]
MDFGTLLHMAKKNSETNKNDGKYYSTKFAPPKKESKEKKLSDNIKKFLQKKEEEERAKQREQQEKLNNLLSMRDEKSKNKIRKMLKVTKSANRSVLEDAVNTEHTAITMAGVDQPDADDYGYVSTEANSFFQKYIDKVKDVKEDKGFAPSRPQSLKDLTGTKERVKAAITREIEEKNSHTRTRTPKEHSSSSSGVNVARSYQTSKNLYDPEAERRAEEEERRKREEEIRKKRKEIQKRPPPPMDFQALLKLAEQKQHQPIEIPVAVPKKKEPERLLTSREKREMEERERAKKAREQRERERNEEPKKSSSKSSGSSSSSATSTNAVQRMEPNGRIPKLGQAGSSNGSSKTSSSADRKPLSHDTKKSSSSSSSSTNSSSKHTSSSINGSSSKSSTHTSSSSSSTKPKPSASSSNASKSSSSNSSSSSNKASSTAAIKNPYGTTSKQPYNGPAREFPPRDPKLTKTREFPPPDVQKTRQFPPPDVQKTRQFPPPDVRRGPGPSSKYGDSRKTSAPKRRILDDDDDSEYDSELDDFIDDGDEEEDYSSHIKAIFGYDKSKYRDIDEEDDRMMEASFAQIQREEYISKKIGMQEDLEDMKLEAMEKKRKMMKKRRLAD